jgi:hypothetical protein
MLGDICFMKPSRLFLLVVAGCCLARPEPLCAQVVPPPFTMDKPFSADITVAIKDSMTVETKTYSDGDKLRSEVNMNGIQIVAIYRKDEQKIYQIIPSQKVIMEMAYDPDKLKGHVDTAYSTDDKFELIGTETVDGVPCTKYKVTSDKTKQAFFYWLDLANKVPVKMVSEDGAMTVTWKNYKVAPQDEALFVPPTDYQTMPMPEIPGMSGGGSGGGDSSGGSRP